MSPHPSQSPNKDDPDQLLKEFLDDNLPLPDLPERLDLHDPDPEEAWDSLHKTPAGMVPLWFPRHLPGRGKPLNDQQRHRWFLEALQDLLPPEIPRPPESSASETMIARKHDVALALLRMLSKVRGQELPTPDWL